MIVKDLSNSFNPYPKNRSKNRSENRTRQNGKKR